MKKSMIILALGLTLAACNRVDNPLIEVKIVRCVASTTGWHGTSAYTMVDTTNEHQRMLVMGIELGNPGEIVRVPRSSLYNP